jgi:hypothetical protein
MMESDAESGEIPTTREMTGERDVDLVIHSLQNSQCREETSLWDLDSDRNSNSISYKLTFCTFASSLMYEFLEVNL